MRAIPIAPLCLSVFVVAARAPYAKIIQHPGNPLYARVYNADVSSEGRIVTLGSAELGSSVTVYNDSALAQWAKRLAPARFGMYDGPQPSLESSMVGILLTLLDRF